MGKQKYTITENIECVGVIDKVEGTYMINVDGEEITLEEIVDKCLGYEISIKCVRGNI